jgi:hypothetical protein
MMQVAWWILTRLMAPFLALCLPMLILYGAASPREADIAAIRHAGGSVPLLVGTGNAQRLYLAYPEAITEGALTVVEDGRDGPTVTVMPGLALVFMTIWIVSLYATWYFFVRTWFKPRTKPRVR